ncbi:MAG TPA: VOC family protein [Polyangiaceae bacterium]|nr:VOC family protein [Polyangiaceae bacterium]
MTLARPFRVLGLQQVALGASDRAQLRALWVELLGLRVEREFESQAENVLEDILRLGPEPWSVEIDLMQPFDPARSPKVHVPALNHIGLWIDDLPAAVTWLEAKGVRFGPGGIRPGAAGHDVCFIHPKPSEQSPLSGAGVLIELVQAPAQLIAAFDAQPNGQSS